MGLGAAMCLAGMGGISSLDPADEPLGVGVVSPAPLAISGCGLDFSWGLDRRLLVEGGKTALAVG